MRESTRVRESESESSIKSLAGVQLLIPHTTFSSFLFFGFAYVHYLVSVPRAVALCVPVSLRQAEIDSAVETVDFLRMNGKFAEDIYKEQPHLHSPNSWVTRERVIRQLDRCDATHAGTP